MGVELTKDSIDLGIVTRDAEAALKFYRDTLGFKAIGEMPMPGTGTMHMLLCGKSMIKIVELEKEPKGGAPAPGGIRGATGYRYWTISVSNLAEMIEACEKAGYEVKLRQGAPAPREDLVFHIYQQSPQPGMPLKEGVPIVLTLYNKTSRTSAKPAAGRN